MISGTRPSRIDHRDFDYHKSFGSPTSATFPETYLCDAGLTMPNQEAEDDEFIPSVPPMPYGCTDETQADLATDLTGQKHNPLDLENVTHANAQGGLDIRTSLKAAISLGWITGFFNVINHGQLDSFDTFRLAQVSGIPEKRSISLGCPWFPSWENAALQGQYVMPMPTPEEITQATAAPNTLPWHNSKLDGWTLENGQPVYRDKSWQGKNVGKSGFIAFDRPTINVIMGINGVVAFTTTKGTLPPITTIPVSLWQWLVSNVKNLLGLQY